MKQRPFHDCGCYEDVDDDSNDNDNLSLNDCNGENSDSDLNHNDEDNEHDDEEEEEEVEDDDNDNDIDINEQDDSFMTNTNIDSPNTNTNTNNERNELKYFQKSDQICPKYGCIISKDFFQPISMKLYNKLYKTENDLRQTLENYLINQLKQSNNKNSNEMIDNNLINHENLFQIRLFQNEDPNDNNNSSNSNNSSDSDSNCERLIMDCLLSTLKVNEINCHRSIIDENNDNTTNPETTTIDSSSSIVRDYLKDSRLLDLEVEADSLDTHNHLHTTTNCLRGRFCSNSNDNCLTFTEVWLST